MRSALLLALSLAVSACSASAPTAPAAPPPASAPDAVGVGRVLDDFHDAAARADEPRYFAHFAKDGVFLGTDATERWDVAAFRAYAHPHFAKGKAWTFHATLRHVAFASDGAVAWFDETLDAGRLGAARGSGVLVREAGEWKVAQYNLALTIPNERFDAVHELLEAPPSASPSH